MLYLSIFALIIVPAFNNVERFDMADTSKNSPNTGASKVARAKPLKPLPTARLAFEKQLSILRAYAAASTNERNAVSNSEVGKIAEIDPNSVSLCNPFFRDVQLIIKDGYNHRPSDAVMDYFQAWKWNEDTAALKLKPALETSWFAVALSPRLDFRSMTKTEAMQVLAEEIKAPKEFEGNLSVLLDFLKVAGIVTLENGSISIAEKGANVLPITPTPVNAIPPNPQPNATVVSVDKSLHPFISGLLKTLPDAETEWTLAGRIKWLQAASNIFGLIYTDTSSDENEYIEITKKKL